MEKFVNGIQDRILYIRNCKIELESQSVKNLMNQQKEALAMMGGNVKTEMTVIYSNGKTIYLNKNGAIVPRDEFYRQDTETNPSN